MPRCPFPSRLSVRRHHTRARSFASAYTVLQEAGIIGYITPGARQANARFMRPRLLAFSSCASGYRSMNTKIKWHLVAILFAETSVLVAMSLPYSHIQYGLLLHGRHVIEPKNH